jgi:hypothetical protein
MYTDGAGRYRCTLNSKLSMVWEKWQFVGERAEMCVFDY